MLTLDYFLPSDPETTLPTLLFYYLNEPDYNGIYPLRFIEVVVEEGVL